MYIVIVESPAKAKTINNYLGKNYKVLPSFGHVRDLPAKDGSVKPDDNFSMSWLIDPSSTKHIAEISKSIKDADGLILATDPDREGEAISWHVLEILKEKKALKNKKVSRVIFNAITKQSILKAMDCPRDIDIALVEAYLARRALDYLVGFTLSPILWHKLPGSRSAGRVQSVALRLICERESEIERFISEEYWKICPILQTKEGCSFETRLTALHGNPLHKLSIKTENEANEIKSMLESSIFTVTSIETKPIKRNPYPPFTTSTLQQAAASQLGFSPSRTMQIAQRLYEGIEINNETKGLITYMRTDGVHIAPEAIDEARTLIGQDFGSSYLPEKPILYKAKAKNAQEAHEAIRPTDFLCKPSNVEKYLNSDQAKLYEIIWKRTIASQMKAAEIDRTTISISAKKGQNNAELRCSGSVIRFDGFMRVFEYQDEDNEEENHKRLPKIQQNETPTLEEIKLSQHATEPPPRYSEAGLIKKMEELGIGRPSTYASILKTLEDRDYISIDKRKLLPHSRGRIVTAFLHGFFQKYVEYDFTADLEKKLDEISDGKLNWKEVLSDFWKEFSSSVEEIKELRVTDVLNVLNDTLASLLFPKQEEQINPRACPKCEEGTLSLKLGRYGAFVGCSHYPSCNYTRHLGDQEKEDSTKNSIPPEGKIIVSKQAEEEDNIVLKTGRFGSYFERGEGKEAKRVTLPKGWDPENIDPVKAKALFSLPREIGKHPETDSMISAGLGRYGPFLLHKGGYTNLSNIEEVFDIDLTRAIEIIAQNPSKKSFTQTTSEIKNLGAHPNADGDITVRSGRYGPYINYKKINVTFPKGILPETITKEEALSMLAEKTPKSVKKKSTARKKT